MHSIKILQLNVWGGRIKDGLTNFIKEGNYDLICLQEAVWDRNHTKALEYFMDTVDKIKEEANFEYDTRSSQFGISILNNTIHYESGNAILSKIPFKHSEEKILHGEYCFATNLDQYEQAVKHNLYTAQKVILENSLTVINYHGYWLKDPLGDETSISCMRSVADMISSDKNPVVLCGDLNVIPEAKAMRELDFLRDLTAIHNIPTTLRNIRFTKDEHVIKMQQKLKKVALKQEYIRQVHGFYLLEAKKQMRFDLVVSFDAENRLASFKKAVAEIQKVFPDYQLQAVMDADFTEEQIQKLILTVNAQWSETGASMTSKS